MGGSWETFDPKSVIKKCSTDNIRWVNEEKGPRSWKSRNFAEVNVKSLSDDETFSENGGEERYLFTSDSK